MKREQEEGIHRRRVIEAGVAGAALLVLPEACGSSTGNGSGDASTMDATTPKDGMVGMDSPMETDTGGPCKTDFVDAGGSCAQSDQTAAVNIMKAGLAQPGTSYEFSDCRFMDTYGCMSSQIILIHPTTKMGYVALSGACPHECCNRAMGSGGPTYLSSCRLSVDTGIIGGFDCNDSEDGGSSDGGSDARADGGVEGGADAATDAGADATSDAGPGLHGGKVLTDVLYCTCHGSIFDALTGAVINGPASVGLDKLDTCDADGWIFVTIPKST